MEKTSYYLGIDLDNDNAVISYFQLNMKEPETVSTVAGSIPDSSDTCQKTWDRSVVYR